MRILPPDAANTLRVGIWRLESEHKVAFRLWIDLPREKKYNQAKTQAHAAQMIRGGALGEWDVCLLCFFGPLVA